jgi:hypothetical protein
MINLKYNLFNVSILLQQSTIDFSKLTEEVIITLRLISMELTELKNTRWY